MVRKESAHSGDETKASSAPPACLEAVDDDEVSQEEALNAGASFYIEKPISMAAIYHLLNESM